MLTSNVALPDSPSTKVANADLWKQSGTGLGLALCEKRVEQLGGD